MSNKTLAAKSNSSVTKRLAAKFKNLNFTLKSIFLSIVVFAFAAKYFKSNFGVFKKYFISNTANTGRVAPTLFMSKLWAALYSHFLGLVKSTSSIFKSIFKSISFKSSDPSSSSSSARFNGSLVSISSTSLLWNPSLDPNHPTMAWKESAMQFLTSLVQKGILLHREEIYNLNRC